MYKCDLAHLTEQRKARISLYNLEFLFEPALTRVKVSTAQLLIRFDDIVGIRPFSFIIIIYLVSRCTF